MAGPLIDFYAAEIHHHDHLVPIWDQMDERGTFYVEGHRVRHLYDCPGYQKGTPPPGSTPTVVASYHGYQACQRPIVYMEHGASLVRFLLLNFRSMDMKRCKVDGCDGQHQAKGYCLMHYNRARLNNGDPGPVGRMRKVRSDRVNFDCSVEGCDLEAYRDQLCRGHATRKRRGQSLTDPPLRRKVRSAQERWHQFVTAGSPDECWHWQGTIVGRGYGQFYDGGKVYAHIWAYRQAKGEIPEGWDVDHTCHNADESCPGGATCMHRRCCNPDHLEAVPHGVNVRRARVGGKRRPGAR